MSSADIINNLADFYYQNQENLSADTVNYYLHNNLIVTNRDPIRQLRQLKSSLLTHFLREQHLEGNLVPQMQRIIKVTNDANKTLYIEYQTHNLASQNSMLPLVSPRYIKHYMPHIYTNVTNYARSLELEKQYHADMRKIRYQFQCDQYLGLLRAGIHFPIKEAVNIVPIWPQQIPALGGQPMSTTFGGVECQTRPTQSSLFATYGPSGSGQPINRTPQPQPRTPQPPQPQPRTQQQPPRTQQQQPGQAFPFTAPLPPQSNNNPFTIPAQPPQQQTTTGFGGLNPQAPLNTSFGTPLQSDIPFSFNK